MFQKIYLNNRVYLLAICNVMLFICAFAWPVLFLPAKIFLLFCLLCIIIDYIYLNKISNQLDITREVSEKLSLGDDQDILYHLSNKNKESFHLKLYDELPYQLQFRNYIYKKTISNNSTETITHSIRPVERGEYNFGNTIAYISSRYLNLISFKKSLNNPFQAFVFPSIIQMRKFQLKVFSKTATLAGVRRTRNIGENDEFEHIRPYLQGDNIKSINWKATSRKAQLMVNQYQNSRSQMVYCIIDKGRSMKMPFYGLTLLDHAINSALVLSNIILKKYDKSGLITFSDKIGTVLKAKSIVGQLENISERLFNQKTDFTEANFELLYYTMRKQITKRSIILFYTNFEHYVDLERNLSYLKGISKKHLLIVILFINTEILYHAESTSKTVSDIYKKTFASKAIIEKEKIAYQLNINGIQTILTKPADLSINVINKYLEIKSKRMR